MDTSSFEVLETKINKILAKIEALQSENKQLHEQVSNWKARSEDAANQIKTLSAERDELKKNQRDLAQEDLIRSKVTTLLSKLENL